MVIEIFCHKDEFIFAEGVSGTHSPMRGTLHRINNNCTQLFDNTLFVGQL